MLKHFARVLCLVSTCSAAAWSADLEGLWQATAWTEGLCLIRIAADADLRAARDDVSAAGGGVAVILPPEVILGWVPPSVEPRVLRAAGVRSIERGAVDESSFTSEEAKRAARAFNWVKAGHAEEEIFAAAGQRGVPLTNDAFLRPPPGADPFERIPTTISNRSEHYPNAANAGCGNSESMSGVVAVSMFFVESDGSIDPNQYSWSTQHQTDTFNRAVAGLAWWAAMAPAYGQSVTFVVLLHGATDSVCQQPYEPILHPSDQDFLWINRIVTNLGAASVDSFNAGARASTGADWAYSIFIAYNPGVESTFTDGYFAYAYLGGPYTQLCYNNDGWGAANFGNVLAHETAHIFWADDEYFQAGYGGCTNCGNYGNCPRPSATNGNCEFCSAHSRSCIMRDGTPAYGLCSYTPPQIGWYGGPSGQADLSGRWGRVRASGRTVTARLTCTNNGSSDAGGFAVRIYFSRNGSLSGSSYAGTQSVGGIPAGSSSSFRFRGNRPSRSYRYIFAEIDAGGEVAETNESNNTPSASLR